MDLTLGGHVYHLTDRRNAFINPATATVYEWPVNHLPEGDEGTEKKRAIQETANTGNVGLVKQQSGDQGVTIKRSGTILTLPHEQAFWEWWELSSSQTIYFVEFDGTAYEVQIVGYNPKKIGSGGPSKNGQKYFIKYTIEMVVFAFLTGPQAAAGVAA